jgi:glycosyltransferase involved in cell wall biosynthesis
VSLAIVISHPIQYWSPWFCHLTANGFSDLRVFYLWNGGVTEQMDRDFGVPVKWDIPLLNGYDYEFVPNAASRPGTSRCSGLNNPGLIPALESFKPDAILLCGYNYLTHYRLLFSKLSKSIPILFRGDSHRLELRGGLRSKLRRWWISRVLRGCSAFLYVGQANRDYFQYHGVPERKLFFCPHAVDNERFFVQSKTADEEAAKWKTSLGIRALNRVVLFAGKFEPKKRPRDLIAAFKRAKLDHTTLLMVGNGEEEAVLREEASGNPAIVFARFQNQTLMPRTYAAGDVFVLPSFGRDETWGLAVNEAMCLARTVVVSTHVGCAQDLVHHGENGLVFPAGDVVALAETLREALSDTARLKRWGARGREIVKEYDYERATKGLVEALALVKKDNA